MTYFPLDVEQERALELLPSYPGLRSAERSLEAARAGVRESWSGFLPGLELQYLRHDFGRGWNEHGFQVGFSVPLWLPLNGRGRVREARARERDRFWSLQQTRLVLKREIERSWHSYRASEEAVVRFEEVIRDRSDELLARTREGYRLGEIDLERFLEREIVFIGGTP